MGKGSAGRRSEMITPVEEVSAETALREELAAAERRLPELERRGNELHQQAREADQLLEATHARIKDLKTDLAALARSEIRTDVLLAPSEATRRPLSAVLLSSRLPDWPIEHLALRSPRGIRIWWSEHEELTVAEAGARWVSGHLVEPIRVRKASTGQLDRCNADQIMVETEKDGTPCLTYPAPLDVIPFGLLMTIPVSDQINRQAIGALVEGLRAMYTRPFGKAGKVLDPWMTTFKVARAAFARGERMTITSSREFVTRANGAWRRLGGTERDDTLVRISQWPTPRAKRAKHTS